MASHPPGLCCIQGITHEGTPKGTLENIGGYETYVAPIPLNAQSQHKDAAIVIFTDVFGHKYPNVQLLADQFAANGYACFIPDIFAGDNIPFPGLPRPEGFTIDKWRNGAYSKTGEGHNVKDIEPIANSVIKYLREEKGFKKVGAVGYCFGAKYVVRHMGIAAKPGDSGGADAGFVAHPSFVEEEELENMKGPLSIAAAYHDYIFSIEKRHKSEEILDKIGVPYQINLFSHVEHGFATKADIKNPQAKFAMEKAFLQAIQWFDEYLN